MMKRVAAAALAVIMLSGCARDNRAVPDENGVYPAERLFDWYYSEDMPWDETEEFEVPEFSGVRFSWDNMNVLAEDDGETLCLYWGMPVWSVYLADLNGDGKREICSAVSMGSGIVDDRIYAYDFVNNRLYGLNDRFYYNYTLELKDGVLFYVKSPEHLDGETFSEPLTVDKMTETDKAGL